MPKLVRNRVPNLFPESSYRVLDASEYGAALRAKLDELAAKKAPTAAGGAAP